jgi:hypothetical protein
MPRTLSSGIYSMGIRRLGRLVALRLLKEALRDNANIDHGGALLRHLIFSHPACAPHAYSFNT